MRGREFKTLQSIFPKKTEIVSQKDICIPMLITALFIVEKIWKQQKYPLIEEWIKKLCVCDNVFSMQYTVCKLSSFKRFRN